ncbi:MAG: YhjD/YihY/BrkB family envelope integrity protein, partial [Thermodesulfobacteriota bacterium]
MSNSSGTIERTRHFLRESVWQDPPDADRLNMLLRYSIRVCLITVENALNQMILLRASALCYSTLLAIVPILAVGFSMLKGLGVQSRIEEVLLKYLTAEQEVLSTQITNYIANTDFKALGAFGTGILILAVVVMLGNVESTFNDIWGVTRSRTIARKISDYISVLILGPLLMVLSTALLASLSSNTVVRTLSDYPFFGDFLVLFNTILPYTGLWIAFTAMYLLMPNTRVKFLPALISGIIFGSIWQLAFSLYTDFYVGVVNYNKIYGTFAVLPIFIIWLYISWIIVLIGAQMTSAIQRIKSYQQESKKTTASEAEKESMAFYIMAEIAIRFSRGQPPASTETLSNTLSIPLPIVRNIVDYLSDSGLIREIDSEEQTVQPARDLDLIRLSDIYAAIR